MGNVTDSKVSTTEFLNKVGIKYKKIDYYIMALTHSSFTNENVDVENYERLEFLGDSILGRVVSEHIFRNFPSLKPGEMSMLKAKVISKEFLSNIGRTLEVEKYSRFGVGEGLQQQHLSDGVFEDIIEALVAAIYLDLGEVAAKQFISDYILVILPYLDLSELKDAKTKLQEYFQAEKREAVEYLVTNTEKTDQGIYFHVDVMHEGVTLGSGSGKSKKVAQQNAAKMALGKLIPQKEPIKLVGETSGALIKVFKSKENKTSHNKNKSKNNTKHNTNNKTHSNKNVVTKQKQNHVVKKQPLKQVNKPKPKLKKVK